MYDLVIVGGGPAGVAAGVYAARKKMKTVIVTDSFGGQSIVSADVQNWIGEKSISGFDLAQKMEAHLRSQEGIEIVDGDLVAEIKEIEPFHFSVATKNGKKFEARAILLVSGSRRKKLGVPGEKELEGRGVVYCSICDAPLFGGKDVAVVGGGNSGLEAVRDLLPYAKEIYLLHHRSELKGDKETQEKVLKPNVHVVLNAETQSVDGKDNVEGLTYKDLQTGEVKKLPVQGVFVEVGLLPNSEMVKGLVDLNQMGAVAINFQTQAASRPGIWAAGDVADSLYRQNNISMGDAVKATLNIYDTLHAKGLLSEN
ncbi:FAD-dependent oxidoreductase [Patescibacteria group bacterium]|nr:FAD-dependent oxidoreductase [Patescibacteria group bacterium]